MIRRGGLFGQFFPLIGHRARSPLAPLARAYAPYLPVIVVLGLIASLVEGFGITLLIPLVALLLSDSLPAGLPGPVVDLASKTSGLNGEMRILALGAVVMGFIVVKGLLQAVNSAFIAYLDGRLARDVRNALCSRILTLDYPFILKNESGRLVQIISTDCWYASEAVRAVLTMIPAVIALAVFTLILLWLDWRLTVIIMSGALLIQGALVLLERRQRRFGFTVANRNHVLGERMFAVVRAIRAIRIFGQRERELERFSQASDEVRRGIFSVQWLSVCVVPLVEVLISLLFVAVLLMAYHFGTPIPAITAYLVLLAAAQPYAHTISRSRIEFAALAGSLREVEWLLTQEPAAESLAGNNPVRVIDQPIRFDHVSYNYPDGTPALESVDVLLRNGVTTALIGKSGAGKSSFVDLLCRLIEPEAGAIYHGDRPLIAIDPEAWRSRIAMAGQNVDLVDGTISENIAYGKPDSTQEEIEQAARAACAHKFVSRLPNGYATWLGLDGLKLSAGERQRIGLARALLRKPDLLILDEATSAVDRYSEQEIIGILKQRRWFSNALVISHHRATLAACEDGIVMDQGRILEVGPLGELAYFHEMAAALDH